MHAIIPPVGVNDTVGVTPDADALLPVSIASEEGAAAEATDGAIVQVLRGAITTNGTDTGQGFTAFGIGIV